MSCISGVGKDKSIRLRLILNPACPNPGGGLEAYTIRYTFFDEVPALSETLKLNTYVPATVNPRTVS